MPTTYASRRNPAGQIGGLQPWQIPQPAGGPMSGMLGGPAPAGVVPRGTVGGMMGAGQPRMPGLGGLSLGGAPGSALSGLFGGGAGDYGSMIRSLIGQGQAAGAFGPDYLRDQLKRHAMATQEATRNRSQTLASLLGLDPNQQRVALLQSEIGGQGNMANALNEAQLQGYSSYQDLIRQLLGGERNFQQQKQLAAMQAKAMKDAQSGGFLGGIGGLIGTGLGGWLAPGGLFKGKGG